MVECWMVAINRQNDDADVDLMYTPIRCRIGDVVTFTVDKGVLAVGG